MENQKPLDNDMLDQLPPALQPVGDEQPVELKKMTIPPNPTVSFRFTGLLVFCFDPANNRAQIGIQTTTSEESRHELRIYLTKMAPTPVKTIPITFSHESIRDSGDLFVEVIGPRAGSEGIQIYKSNEGVDRQTMTGDPNDFAWIPDLENNSEFYSGPLELEPGILTPCLNFNHGLFYTATITEDKALKNVDGDVSDFGFVAEYVGVNLYLQKNGKLILRMGENGPALATFEFSEGVTYFVTVENTAAPQTETRNHFSEYYSAVHLNGQTPIVLKDPPGQVMTAESGSCTAPVMLGVRTSIK